MAFKPAQPFPKEASNVIRAQDWNDLVGEMQRLDAAKVNLTGELELKQPLKLGPNVNIGDSLGIGTTKPKRMLHVENNEIHSGGASGGFSFSDRGARDLVESPDKGQRWVWYSQGGVARLWSGTDKLSVDSSGVVQSFGLFAPKSLNVGGVDAGADPGLGSMWVAGSANVRGDVQINGSLKVLGDLEAGGALTVKGPMRAARSDLYFTDSAHEHTGDGNLEGCAAIENANKYGALMILGRSVFVEDKGQRKFSHRNVNLYDNVEVNRDLKVKGEVWLGTDNKVVHIGSNLTGTFVTFNDDLAFADPQDGTVQLKNGENSGIMVGQFRAPLNNSWVKEAKELDGGGHRRLLDAVAALPVYSFKYKGVEETRWATLSEKVDGYPELKGANNMICLESYIGMLHGAMKMLKVDHDWTRGECQFFRVHENTWHENLPSGATASTTYTDAPGPYEKSFKKHSGRTALRISIMASAYISAGGGVFFGIRLNSNDYDVSAQFFNTANCHFPVCGVTTTSVLPAGDYTARLRWKVTGGTATVDINDRVSLSIQEVWA